MLSQNKGPNEERWNLGCSQHADNKSELCHVMHEVTTQPYSSRLSASESKGHDGQADEGKGGRGEGGGGGSMVMVQMVILKPQGGLLLAAKHCRASLN